ncbi:hypothetical protein [Candidiatus Paracoxiella cheracis]|uniref:hypothetical protein n=1 Tax=Candidiatus Paracoxiella cheracis TaxID=3405120 RepID=UPI003BF5AB4F
MDNESSETGNSFETEVHLLPDFPEQPQLDYGTIDRLHNLAPSVQPPTRIEKFGKVCTIAAMIPQGIFGGLLIVIFAQEVLEPISKRFYYPVAIFGGGLVAFGAAQGKIDIVWDFGQRHWKKLASKTVRQFLTDLSPHTWVWDESPNSKLPLLLNHLLGLIEWLFRVNTSCAFGMLARVAYSEEGASGLAKKIGVEPFMWLGEYLFPNPFWQAAFGIPAIVTNFLCFASIHRYGIHCILQMFNNLFNCDINNLTTEQIKARAVFDYFVSLINNNEIENAKNLLQNITKISLNNNALNYYHEHQSECQRNEPRPKTHCEHLITCLLGYSGVGLTILGLLNFLEMWNVINSTLPESLQLPELAIEIMNWMLFISMALMGATVYPQVKSTAESAFFKRREPNIQFCSNKQSWWNYFKAQVICVVGSTPNVFQALLAGLKLPSAIAAFFASWCLEIRAVLGRYEEHEKRKALKSDTTGKHRLGYAGHCFLEAVKRNNPEEVERIAGEIQAAFNPS